MTKRLTRGILRAAQALPALAAVLALSVPPAAAQDEGAVVDTTFTTEQGVQLRYRGVLKPGDQAEAAARAEARRDDRVPLGYGWKTVMTWQEGDPRPEPLITDDRIVTEFFDIRFSPYVPRKVAASFAEYGDFAHFAIKDRLGWEAPAPIPLQVPFDMKAYGLEYGLPWWMPGDVRGDTIVMQPISAITARGICMESMTHLALEWHLRRLTGDRLPYWLVYGAGAFIGGEGWVLEGQVDVLRRDRNVEVDQATMVRDLELFRDRELMMREVARPGGFEEERCRSRIAFWRAYRLAEAIITQSGLQTFKTLVETMAADPALSFADAVRRVYGMGPDELVAAHEPW
ncbi:MAG: hypothetical protein JW819_01975 [Candidatus Krumholzibacteriota bacterium]|nr:hypothetical protein [Candidatus Krumholzibacteriota bacterium]